MLKLDVPAWNIALRTAAIYLVALVGLRLAGKREIGQMTVFDLVVLLLIANAVQNAMVGPDTSLTGGVLAAVVLLVLNAVVARLRLPGLGFHVTTTLFITLPSRQGPSPASGDLVATDTLGPWIPSPAPSLLPAERHRG
jgi:hypothetical protein